MASAEAEATNIFRKLLGSIGGSNSHGGVWRPWGSDPTAASGGGREESEWQRSIKSRESVSSKILSGTAAGGSEATQIRNLPKQVATIDHGRTKKYPLPKAEGTVFKKGNYLEASSTATATETVMPTMGLLPAPRKPIIST